ncbi:hypothetical protein IEN85_18415 [Pelagicoccus sp. NFK12]|uniref:TIGR03546 family protein n=1 Tax=Pelagicoccus enzymogenes TaxID=2773457 RepID=A0A927FBV9_9BACT|nr:hypothetical protein [Pelagicoccus enzymogenes]MBD5781481.1 hypothetical protein [Pelagicoccus enzymogenes]
MIVTRKIGSLIRGKTTPFQIYAACILGALIGFIPSFSHAPALVAFWILLLLVLNANLFLAGIVLLLSKLVLLLAMPLVFAIGRFLLEGPTQGLFKALINAPVTAYSGLDYYAVAGGQLLALILGFALAFVLKRSITNYRKKMMVVSEDSARLKKYNEKLWVKALKFLFLGKGRGKKSYEELLSVKMGNPIRIWGLAIVVLLGAVIGLGFSKLSAPLLTSLAKSNLETANGATVDLESVDLSFGESKLEVLGLALADAQNLDTNIFSSKRIVADVNTADLLRKRFSIDNLVIEDAASGDARETPGVQIGPKPKTDSKIEMPDFDDLDSVLENADVWKERLAQAKRWLEQMTAGGEEAQETLTWREELNSRIRALGHANVKADFLTEGSPTLWIRRIEAKGIKTPYFEGALLDLNGADLSTHPALAAAAPTLSLVADNQKFDARLSLAGASGTGTNDLKMLLKQVAVDPLASKIKSDGNPPVSGGSMDIDLSGVIGTAANDLVAKVTFDGTQARIGGNPVDLDGITLPLQIRGPLDRPGIKLESDALQKLAGAALKKKATEEVSKKLGLEGDEAEAAGKLLDGLFKKKK